MQFVRIEPIEGPWPGEMIDPNGYLDVLPGLLPQMPPGARAFASDESHYDFNSVRCVKDLTVNSVSFREAGHGRMGLLIEFGPNEFKHDAGLVLTYSDVTSFTLTTDGFHERDRVWPVTTSLGTVQLDEVLPLPGGCSHEWKTHRGRLYVECADLHAEWVVLDG